MKYVMLRLLSRDTLEFGLRRTLQKVQTKLGRTYQ